MSVQALSYVRIFTRLARRVGYSSKVLNHEVRLPSLILREVAVSSGDCSTLARTVKGLFATSLTYERGRIDAELRRDSSYERGSAGCTNARPLPPSAYLREAMGSTRGIDHHDQTVGAGESDCIATEHEQERGELRRRPESSPRRTADGATTPTTGKKTR
jgi:hypothetical protein